METKAVLRNTRISPRKVQIILDLIRNQPIEKALAILQYTPKAACEPLYKLLKSAQANAANNNGADSDSLVVSTAYVAPGMIMKRVMPRAQGRAFRINKRTSHITIGLKEIA